MIRFYSKQTGRWTDQWSHPALRGYGQTDILDQTFSSYEEAIANYRETIAIQRETIQTLNKTIEINKESFWKKLATGVIIGATTGIVIGYFARRKR